MRKTYPFHILIRNGSTEPSVFSCRAYNISQAFAKCARRLPEAELLEGWTEGSYKDSNGIIRRGAIHYSAPSTTRIIAEPGQKAEQLAFDFLSQISFSKKSDHMATVWIPQNQMSQST
jgi:hypothetical protein